LNTSRINRAVPIIGLLCLLLLSGQRMPADWSAESKSGLSPQIVHQVEALLVTGASQGYVSVLREASLGAVLDMQVLDRNGVAIARWPEPWTAHSWGPLAAVMQATREAAVQLISQPQSLVLKSDERVLGELAYYELAGLSQLNFKFALDAILALLAVFGVALVARAPPGRAVASVVPKRSRSNVERLGLRLGPALDQAQLGVVMLNNQQKIRYLNPAAGSMLGWDTADALNLPVYSVLRIAADKERAEPGNPFAMGPQDPSSQDLNVTVLSRDGRSRDLQITLLRLRRANNKLGGMLMLLKCAQDQSAALDVLQREAELARKTLDSLGDGVVITDKYGRIQRVNQRLCRLFSYSAGELDGVAISKLLPVPFLNDPTMTLNHYLGSSREELPSVVGWRKDATTFPVELQVQELYDDTHAFLLLIKDRGELQRQGNLAMRLGRLLDCAAEEIYIFDAHSLYITEINREARDNLSYSLDQLTRMTPLHLAPTLNRTEFERDLAALRNGEQRQLSYRTDHRRADGSRYPAFIRISFSREEEPPVFMALVQDITEQRVTEARLEYLALNDVLTGLPNRAALTQHLDECLNKHESGVLLYFFDLDRFKSINDHFGHQAGDAVLIEFGRRLSEQLPPDYFAARLSGDEFAVVGRQRPGHPPDELAQCILECLQTPFEMGDLCMQIRSSIGGASSKKGEQASSLLKRADVAMYEAKSAGGQGFRLSLPEVQGE
jgi:diguanylate cyclase (GGDEF)-like protein/PAS domain S-box-containing protein